jgi:uncharacterized phage protein (TIGR02218 family)
MARTLTLDQLASIRGPSLTLCRTWDFVRKDGKAAYMTDHDRPVVLGDKRYMPVRTLNSTAATRGGGFQPRDKEMKGAIDSDVFVQEELLAGLWRNCFVKEAVVDWQHPERGQFLTDVYWFKTLSFDGQKFTAGVEGLSGWTDKPFGRNYTRDCNWNFGDRNCRADTSSWEVADVAVTGVTDGYGVEFDVDPVAADPANAFRNNGVLVWKTGANAGLSHVVRGHDHMATTISLWLEPIFPVVVGDTFDLYPGCQKTLEACKAYDNVLNYGGFPALIGNDEMISSPDSNE